LTESIPSFDKALCIPLKAWPSQFWFKENMGMRAYYGIYTFCRFDRLFFLSALILFLLIPSFAMAEEQEELFPGFIPSLKVGVNSDDNIYRSPLDKNSDTIITASPSLSLLALYGKHSFKGSYKGDYGQFQEYSDENYWDHKAAMWIGLDLSRIVSVKVEGEYLSGHELRGYSGTRTKMDSKPDTVLQDWISGQITIGRRENTLQFVLTAEGLNRQYTNNDQESRDRKRSDAKLMMYYNLSNKTSLLVEASTAKIEFVNPAIVDLDSQETSLRIGIKWEATAMTRGQILVGQITKTLDDPELDSFSGLGVTGVIHWQPKDRIRLSMVLTRATAETAEIGSSYYVTSRSLLMVDYDYSDRLEVGAYIDYQNDKFSNIREDSLEYIGAQANYSLARWLTMNMRYRYESRSSNIEDYTYKANIVAIALVMEAM